MIRRRRDSARLTPQSAAGVTHEPLIIPRKNAKASQHLGGAGSPRTDIFRLCAKRHTLAASLPRSGAPGRLKKYAFHVFFPIPGAVPVAGPGDFRLRMEPLLAALSVARCYCPYEAPWSTWRPLARPLFHRRHPYFCRNAVLTMQQPKTAHDPIRGSRLAPR